MNDSELKRLIEQSGEETRRHFDVVAEGLDRKIETVAEAVITVDERITRFDEKVDRRFEEVSQGFAETQAMIKFSYPESSTADCVPSKKRSRICERGSIASNRPRPTEMA